MSCPSLSFVVLALLLLLLNIFQLVKLLVPYKGALWTKYIAVLRMKILESEFQAFVIEQTLK